MGERASIYIKLFSKNKIYDLNNFEGTIEGGDVILFNNMVWIGISERTTKNAVENLSKILQRNQKDLNLILSQLKKNEIKRDCLNYAKKYQIKSEIILNKYNNKQSGLFKDLLVSSIQRKN